MTMNVMAEGPNGKRLVKNLVDPGAGEENGVASTEGDEEVVSEAPVHCCGVGMVDFSLWNIIVHHLMLTRGRRTWINMREIPASIVFSMNS